MSSEKTVVLLEEIRLKAFESPLLFKRSASELIEAARIILGALQRGLHPSPS